MSFFKSWRGYSALSKETEKKIVFYSEGKSYWINFKAVTAKVLHLSAIGTAELTNRLVCIENADPGFDWIFSRDIAGLVTKFGGVNSHMAVRCAEYGLPAAIGCGEKLFSGIINSDVAELNPSEKILRSLDL